MFEQLPPEVVDHVLDHVKKKWRHSAGAVCAQWRHLMVRKQAPPFKASLRGAMKSGRMLLWAISAGLDLPALASKSWQKDEVLRKAVNGGDRIVFRNVLSLLKLVPKKHHAEEVVRRGHMGILRELRYTEDGLDTQLRFLAARHGQLEMLAWFKYELSWSMDSWVCDGAVEAGRVEVLKWLMTHGDDRPSKYRMALVAAEHDQTVVLNWLFQLGHTAHVDALRQALRWRRKAALSFLVNRMDSGRTWKDFCLGRYGQLSMESIEWLHKKGYSMYWVCWGAGFSGDYDLVLGLDRLGCSMDGLCEGIDDGGNWHLVGWAERKSLRWVKNKLS